MEELKSFTILKKGKYGFYKNVEEGLQNIYEHKSLHEQNVSTQSTQSTPLIEGLADDFSKSLEKDVDSSAEGNIKVKSSASKSFDSVDDVKKKYDKKVDIMEEEIQNIEEAGKNGDIAEVFYNLYNLSRDSILFVLSWFELIDVTAHPNVLDLLLNSIIEAAKKEKMNPEEDETKLTEEERARNKIVKEGIIQIIGFVYSCLFLIPVYFATENWFIYLFYGGEDMTSDFQFDNWVQAKYGTVWELFINAVKFPVVTLSHVLLMLRTKTKNVPKEAAVYVRIALFLFAFGMMNNWSSMWNSTTHNYFYTMVMAIFFIMVAFYIGSNIGTLAVGGMAAIGTIIIRIIAIIILYFSLVALFGFFDGIAKMLVFLFLIFHSFVYIGYKYGFGVGFTKIREVHNESRILYEDEYHKRTGLEKVFFFVSRLINEAWFSVCVVIIMGHFLGSMILNASVPYDVSSVLSILIISIITGFGVWILGKWFTMLRYSQIDKMPDGYDETVPEGRIIPDEEMKSKSLQDQLIKATKVEPVVKTSTAVEPAEVKLEALGDSATAQPVVESTAQPGVVETTGKSDELSAVEKPTETQPTEIPSLKL